MRREQQQQRCSQISKSKHTVRSQNQTQYSSTYSLSTQRSLRSPQKLDEIKKASSSRQPYSQSNNIKQLLQASQTQCTKQLHSYTDTDTYAESRTNRQKMFALYPNLNPNLNPTVNEKILLKTICQLKEHISTLEQQKAQHLEEIFALKQQTFYTVNKSKVKALLLDLQQYKSKLQEKQRENSKLRREIKQIVKFRRVAQGRKQWQK